MSNEKYKWEIIEDETVKVALFFIAVRYGFDCDGDILNVQGHEIFVHSMKGIVTENTEGGKSLGKKVWLWRKDVEPGKRRTDEDRVIIFADALEEAQAMAIIMTDETNPDAVKDIKPISADDLGGLKFTYLAG